ncbi:MAG: hypothetical protein U0586_09270 [Candidatus Brocadiaceae bacterium]
MKHHKIFSVFALLVVSVFPACILPSVKVEANNCGQSFSKRIAGVYFLEQSSGSFRILTITADGNVFGVDSSQSKGLVISSASFSDQQGAWRRTGCRKITATVLNFRFPTDTSLGGTTLARYDVVFDNQFQHIEGSISLIPYGAGVNPFDPDAEPIGDPIVITFKGERVNPCGN